MRRREFIACLAGAAAVPVVRPRAARAQQQPLPVIGFLDSGSPEGMTVNLAGFHAGLSEAGFTEGKNVTIEYRWAQGRYDQLPALAAELVHRPVAVIAATRTSAPAVAAKAATSTIPIVFQIGTDAVKDGLVASFNRPGGNVTGATRLSLDLIQKRLGVILELMPKATAIGLLVNPDSPTTTAQVQVMQEAARGPGLALHVVNAANDRELDAAFAAIAQSGAAALVEGNDPFFIDRRKHIVALTMSYKMPTIFFERESVVDGGLMNYSASFADSFRQVGAYVGRILKGEKPADLPVLQPTKFDLIINLKTAKAIGLIVPPTLLALADEVIE
jgi:putative tryptophan/tyrosine transport system substrate-binding protein